MGRAAYSRGFFNVMDDCLANGYGQAHRDRISDEPAHSFAKNNLAWFCEAIIFAETLDHRTLTQRNSSILTWMPKATVAETKELGGYGGRGLVPTHAAVDARKSLAGLLPVTSGDKITVPVPPGPARSGCLDPSHI